MSHSDGLYGVAQRRLIKRALRLAASDSKTNIVRVFELAERVTPERHRAEIAYVKEQVKADHPALGIARRVTRLAPSCRDGFVNAFVFNALLRGSQKREDFTARAGVPVPFVVLVSPTMRCNLACDGCYAGEYSRDGDMDLGLLQHVVDQANDMGVYLFTILGGEPFVRHDLLDFCARNRDVYFQVFTNGTLFDEETVAGIVEAGNVAPMISIEGDRRATDQRRRPGVYDRIMRAMEALSRAGVLFGYSATVTRRNWRLLVCDEFVDPLVDMGVSLGWHFLYMPVGREPDTSLMLTPEERNEFRLEIERMRRTKAMFPVDFWGDAPYVGGCIAGRHYLHVTSEGWVEPCIFCHFAVDNVNDVSLKDAFASPFFDEIRRRQPFNDNLLLPCMLIDNPHHSREIVALTGARPTHPGAEVMHAELRAELDDYAAEAERVFAPIWACTSARDEAVCR